MKTIEKIEAIQVAVDKLIERHPDDFDDAALFRTEYRAAIDALNPRQLQYMYEHAGKLSRVSDAVNFLTVAQTAASLR